MSLASLEPAWSDGNWRDRVLHRLFRAIAAMSGPSNARGIRLTEHEFLSARKIKGSSACVELSDTSAFFDQYGASGTSISDLKKLVTNDLGRVSPILTDETVILADINLQGDRGANLLHVRKDFLEQITEKAQKSRLLSLTLSPAVAPDILFSTPATITRVQSERRLTTIALGMMLLGAFSLMTILSHKSEQALRELELNEATLRTQLLERTSREQALDSLDQLALQNPNRMSPEGTLSSLAQINNAFPGDSWWSEYSMKEGVSRIKAQSPNAGTTLTAIAGSLPNYKVSFDDTVSDTSDTMQSFVIKLTHLDDANE